MVLLSILSNFVVSCGAVISFYWSIQEQPEIETDTTQEMVIVLRCSKEAHGSIHICC
jgi:hypothetical protein